MMKKLQMTITFDRELGLRCFKIESCWKRRNEAFGQSRRGSKHKNFTKFCRFYFFFIFLLFFTSFFLFHLSILIKKIWKLLWCFFVCIRDLSKNSEKFWIFFFKNRDSTSVGSQNRCSISSSVQLGLIFYIGDLFINKRSICTYYVGYRTKGFINWMQQKKS